MKTKLFPMFFLLIGTNAMAQTMFIDYTERTKANTAIIHLVESKLPIENETFNDISDAKVKLIRIIENYRTDGYTVRSSTVSTHKDKGDFHYHYQYILQKTVSDAEASIDQDTPEKPLRQRLQLKEQKPENAKGAQTNKQPVQKALTPESNRQPSSQTKVNE